jgi:adenylate kinase
MAGHSRFLVGAVVVSCLLHAAKGPMPSGQGQVVIIVGPPGSGKSLQAGKLAKKYKVPVISMATLASEAMQGNQGVAAAAAASLASGEMLSDETAIRLLGARVNQPDAARGFVLDGYPSTGEQAKYLDSFVTAHGLQTPKVVVLQAADDVVRARLLKRKRADDTPENINRRLGDYHREEAFLNSWYTASSTVRVDATKSPGQVFAEMEAGLIELFKKKGFKARPAETK